MEILGGPFVVDKPFGNVCGWKLLDCCLESGMACSSCYRCAGTDSVKLLNLFSNLVDRKSAVTERVQ